MDTYHVVSPFAQPDLHVPLNHLNNEILLIDDGLFVSCKRSIIVGLTIPSTKSSQVVSYRGGGILRVCVR